MKESKVGSMNKWASGFTNAVLRSFCRVWLLCLIPFFVTSTSVLAKSATSPKTSAPLSALHSTLQLNRGPSDALLGHGIPTHESDVFRWKSRPPLFKRSASSAPDTLEIFAIYVEFNEENPDVETTTGRGTFSSSLDTNSKLDPDINGGLRGYRYYLEKHLEFARNYFLTVSNQRLYIRWRIFPEVDSANGKVTPIRLSNSIKAYNPAVKKPEERYTDFDRKRAVAYLAFVVESLRAANAKDKAGQNPFLIPESGNGNSNSIGSGGNTYRSYLLFHAGHSRLVDGGSLGPLNADSPNDFLDFFITKSDFSYLRYADPALKSVNCNDTIGVVVDAPGGAKDTVTEVMVLSEAANQDKTNWGINGILVNQIAQQIGMPNTYDVVRGISQMGFFDLMDFAGYNTLNGFVPVYPSAWVRNFMGWEEPLLLHPGVKNKSQIFSPLVKDSPNKPKSVRINLNEREYLLLENRQRALGDTVIVYLSKGANKTEKSFSVQDSLKVPFQFLDSLLLDSLCNKEGKKCKVNPLRPEGIITGASSYDLGLPGSGLLVWHVNDWYLRTFLQYGAVNAYLGDTLGSRYLGVTLVEADGNLSLGKEFSNALGQGAYDYGSGSDMFPHVVKGIKKVTGKDTTWFTDTVTVLDPYSFASSNAWNDGRTHLSLQVDWPNSFAAAKKDVGVASFTGDSVWTLRDTAITVQVKWADNTEFLQVPERKWPVRSDAATGYNSLALLKTPDSKKPFVLTLSDAGRAQLFTAKGEAAVAISDTLKVFAGFEGVETLLKRPTRLDTLSVPLPVIDTLPGQALGTAILNDTVAGLLSTNRFEITRLLPNRFNADTLIQDSLNQMPADSVVTLLRVALTAIVGPLAISEGAGQGFWILCQGVTGKDIRRYSADAVLQDSIALPDLGYQNLAAVQTKSGSWNLVASAQKGKLVLINVAAHSAQDISPAWGAFAHTDEERFTVSSTDFDRDGFSDVLLLGSRGSAAIVRADGENQGKMLPNFPLRYHRSVTFTDTVYVDTGIACNTEPVRVKVDSKSWMSEDPSPPALADLNGDGYPEFIFAGTNAVFAADLHGAILKGWPFRPSPRQNIGFLYGSKKLPETVIGSSPVVLNLGAAPAVLIGSPDGLIYAVDAAGKAINTSSFDPKVQRGYTSSKRSDWPLSVGGLITDTTENPYVTLSLADLSGTDNITSAGEVDLVAQSGTGGIYVFTLKRGDAKGPWWPMSGGSLGRTQALPMEKLGAVKVTAASASIREFYLFPSPVTGPSATLYLDIGSEAKKARLRIFDLAGNVVAKREWKDLSSGKQPFNQILDLSHLGADVYSALIEVDFTSPAQSKKRWERFGVIR